jgi:ferritin
MIRIISCIAFISFLSFAQSSTTLIPNVGQCLSNLATQELSGSYNYLQLSSKFGTASAYPGFSSLFTKLSDDDSSKAHDLVKFLALRKFKLDRLINSNGVKIRDEIAPVVVIRQGLTEARNQNKEAWKIVVQCHKEADTANDANVQDYLESHLLDHHIEVDKLLTDFEHRLDDAQASEKKLITFMLDEELLNTYGDRRKDIFS